MLLSVIPPPHWDLVSYSFRQKTHIIDNSTAIIKSLMNTYSKYNEEWAPWLIENNAVRVMI